MKKITTLMFMIVFSLSAESTAFAAITQVPGSSSADITAIYNSKISDPETIYSVKSGMSIPISLKYNQESPDDPVMRVPTKLLSLTTPILI